MAKYAKFFSVGGGVGPNGLQLPLGTVLDTTLRQVQDGTGTGSPLYLSTTGLRVGTTAASAMYWDNVNNRLGIGTNAPTSPLSISSTSSSIFDWSRVLGNSGYLAVTNIRTGGGQGTVFGVDSFSFRNGSTNYIVSEGNRLGVGTNNDALTAQLQIKGTGSTSATTSLLVQNSSGTEILRLRDDNVILVNGGSIVGVGTVHSNAVATGYINSAGNAFTVMQTNNSTGSARFYQSVSIGTTADPISGSALQIKTTQSNTNGSIGFLNNSAATIAAVTDTGSALTQLQFRASSYNFTDTTGVRIAGSGYGTVPTAMLQVVGSGSTSATTSLLVQNSAGTLSFKCLDDLTQQFNGYETIFTHPSYTGSLRIYSSGNNQNTIRGGNAESVVFGAGGNTINLNATETYVSNSFLGGSFWIQSNGAFCLGQQATAHASSLFDMRSTTKGFLPPRMTSAQKIAISTPTTGLIVFDTDLVRPCFYNGATWITL